MDRRGVPVTLYRIAGACVPAAISPAENMRAAASITLPLPFMAARAGSSTRGTEASLLATVGRRWAATSPGPRRFRAPPRGRGHRFTRRVTAHARASWRDRSYRTRSHLDGPALDGSLSGAVVTSPTVRVNAALGWGRERPEAERWRHERRWIRAGASVALPRGFTVGASAELRRASYEGNWFPHTAGEPRKDRTTASGFRCTTEGSHGRVSARSFPWCTSGVAPTRSSTTTSAPVASCGSCGCFERGEKV